MKCPTKICGRLASVGVAVVRNIRFLVTNRNLFKYLVFCFSCNFSNLGSILVPTCRNIKYFVVFSGYKFTESHLSHNFSRKYKFLHTKFIGQIESKLYLNQHKLDHHSHPFHSHPCSTHIPAPLTYLLHSHPYTAHKTIKASVAASVASSQQ